jgi:general secretion pathway protein K
MKLRDNSNRVRGIALVMVMIIVVVFAILAGGLAYTMKVETTLARNSSWDMELEWLGRSGIEMAKYVLSQPHQGMQYDALNQIWAGGTGETNDALEGLSLTDNKLGHGTFSLKITDADRKFNINLAAIAPEVLNQGLILMGVDGAESPRIVNAIADWVDKDDKPRIGSTDTESDYYMSLTPPYKAKDGPIDDLTEMMMIKGITPGMYYGSGGGGVNGIQPNLVRADRASRFNRRDEGEPAYPVGFVDLFCALGAQVNFNTASATVMQLFPMVEELDAQAIIEWRAGPNGVDGDEDDRPFKSPGEVATFPQNMKPEAREYLKSNRFVGVRSSSFEVQVDAQIDAVKRTYIAVLRREGVRVVLLYMYWR